jgi:hypothetical protein
MAIISDSVFRSPSDIDSGGMNGDTERLGCAEYAELPPPALDAIEASHRDNAITPRPLVAFSASEVDAVGIDRGALFLGIRPFEPRDFLREHHLYRTQES